MYGTAFAGTTKEGLEWLAQNARKEGVITTSSGFYRLLSLEDKNVYESVLSVGRAAVQNHS